MSPSRKPQLLFWRSPLFLSVVFGCLVFVFGVAYFFYGLQPGVKGGEEKVFRIVRGDRFADIGARLSREGVIKSISVFKVYALLSGQAQKFQPGTYELSQAMSVPEIVRILTTSGSNEVVVTIPEGYTFRDIDALLTAAHVLGKGELLQARPQDFVSEYPFLTGVESFEGFLFPDTYRFERQSLVSHVLSRFLMNFQEKVWGRLAGRKDWYDRLTLASFLEREVPKYEDRRLVAGVLEKRLMLGMPLQVDATISYAKCNGTFLTCEEAGVGKEDLDLSSPYNTYLRRGWTPTPISNPGEEAVRAATLPEKSSYLYYLSARETGETMFAKTLEEHNRNRVKYL